MKALLIALLICGILSILPSYSLESPLWGVTGHELTANIAEFFLDSYSLADTAEILNSTGSLATISAWADSVRSSAQYKWSAGLHFTNIQDWSCEWTPSDCPEEGCVVSAIHNYTQRLHVADFDQRQEALKFLVHFYGDIHQPLHCGFISDKGGNNIQGEYMGSSTNLHSLWDTKLIETRIAQDFGGSQESYTSYLVSKIRGEWADLKKEWIKCPNDEFPCPEVWAQESAHLTCSNVYIYENGTHIESGFELGEEYYQWNRDVVDMQLARGGSRLAAALNKEFYSAEEDNVAKWWMLMIFFGIGVLAGIIITSILIMLGFSIQTKLMGRDALERLERSSLLEEDTDVLVELRGADTRAYGNSLQ
eukprot:TRINITY_DN838_c1_g1_i1.p1 TRINITY_DN838_c1_g1~~TRINITY_DN838_c1_g1_i1.p1  ORF type:complete len:364 (-),score=110.49 TRINITY_DN838_c1_g1_i1:92-1183(-)